MRFKVNYFLLLLGATLFMTTLRSWYAIYQTLNRQSDLDTSTFVQSMTSTLFCHLPFYNTCPGGSFFGVHGSPILIVLLPFYAIMPNFVSLFIVLNIVNYFPSIPLFLMARKSLKSEKLAFIYGLSYVLYPFIYSQPFEVLTLFAGLFIFAFYFYTEKKWIPFFILFALSLSTIEFSPIIGAFFTFYLLTERLIKKELVIKNDLKLMLKTYWLEIFVFLMSVSFFLLEMHMISFFSHGNHSAFSNLYGTNPFSISSLAKGLALDPLSKIMYLIILNAPFLFLAFIDPIFILELPWFLAVMVSVFYPYWYPLVYYGSYIAPFAVLGFLKGVERIRHIIKIRCLKILFSFLLSVNILMWILVNGIAIFHTSPVYPIPSQDLGVFKLADMIPQGSSVYTHSCCLSIVSSHSWDSWFNGNLSTTWMLFNSCNGPPTNISSYKLYAAEGDFMLYKLDYDGPTVVDNYYLNASYGQTYPAIPYSISHRFFIPKGNYTAEIFIKGNGVYPKIINYFSNASSRFYLNSSYALIQRFSINCQINLGELILFGKFSLGEYKIITKISTSLNPSSVIQSSTVIHPSYVINNSEVFRFDNLQLEPDKTYYLWICIEGSPKYVYLQGVHGTNGLYYKVNSNYANVNGSLKFTLVASNDFYSVAHPSNFVVVINNSSYHLQVNKCCTLILHLDLNSPTYVKICFNASEPYSTFRLSVFIHDNNYHELHSFVLQEPYTVLTIFSIPSIIIMLSSLKLKKLSLPRSRLTLITLITLLGIFYVTFSLEYFDLIIVSPIILAIEGLAIAINLAYVFFSEFTVEYIKQ